jgi:hypothetical protein
MKILKQTIKRFTNIQSDLHQVCWLFPVFVTKSPGKSLCGSILADTKSLATPLDASQLEK